MTRLGECPPVESRFSPRSENRLPTSWGLAALLSLCLVGCGRIVSQKATDQLIAGDAVDRSIAQIDFRILTGKKIFLDTQYVNKTVPGVGFVTSEYIISSLRQKMMCDGCLLQEKIDEADFVVEMRIGALGADGHEIIYGMPPNNYLGLAASVAPTSPQAAAILPTMPELSVAKKDDQMAAAKVALFAYNRRTREPIWQSGISESRSVVADRWFMGAGPFHKGSIYAGKNQAPLDAPIFGSDAAADSAKPDYFVERRFADPTKSLADTPPAAKPAVAAPPAANPPAVAAAQPANATTAAAPVAAAPGTAAPGTAVAKTAGPTAAAPAPTAATTPTAAAAPATAPAAAVAAPAAAAPVTAAPAATATQTVNAAPAVATPPGTAAPAANPGPSASAAPPAGSSANVPTNAPKTVPSVNASPVGQPLNEPSLPLNLAPAVTRPDLLSVSSAVAAKPSLWPIEHWTSSPTAS